MLRTLLKDRSLLVLLLLAVSVKIFSLNANRVESLYSTGLYPVLSKVLRTAFGWVPFSVGDVLYVLAFVWLVRKTRKALLLLKRRQAKAHLSWTLLRKYFKLVLCVYLFFSAFWGLNYDRRGIEGQMGLKPDTYTADDLLALTAVLQQRLNACAERIDSVGRLRYNQSGFLFSKAVEAYGEAEKHHPFLAYSSTSVKASLFTPVAHWFGFTGYYNPFSGEAQLKTSIPVFLKPFVVAHEIAHQLGYAKENEASFVAYLTCKHSADPFFLYSVYFEMYRDALLACILTVTEEQLAPFRQNLHPRVKQDQHDLRLYLLRNKNFIEPFVSGAYDKYLKLNNQPKGKATYNEVIAYLVAYMKKFGKAVI